MEEAQFGQQRSSRSPDAERQAFSVTSALDHQIQGYQEIDERLAGLLDHIRGRQPVGLSRLSVGLSRLDAPNVLSVERRFENLDAIRVRITQKMQELSSLI